MLGEIISVFSEANSFYKLGDGKDRRTGALENRGGEAGEERVVSGIISQGGGNQEELRKFCNRNETKRREPLQKGAGNGSKRYGKLKVQTPCPSPPTK